VLAIAACIKFLQNTDKLEQRWAKTAFGSAVKMAGVKSKWERREAEVRKYEEQRNSLAEQIEAKEQMLESAAKRVNDHYVNKLGESPKFQKEDSASSIEGLGSQTAQLLEEERKILEAELLSLAKAANELQEKKESAEQELDKMRLEVQNHIQEAHMSTQKLGEMQHYMRMVCGTFKGEGTGKWKNEGASGGFGVNCAQRAGFRMDTFVFGYPTETTIELFSSFC